MNIRQRTQLFWWWRLVFAVGLVLYATNASPPFLFDQIYEQVVFLAAAALMVIATFRPTVALVTTACIATVGAFMGRAMVVAFVDSVLTHEQIIRGVTTWSLGSFAVIMLTLALDRSVR